MAGIEVAAPEDRHGYSRRVRLRELGLLFVAALAFAFWIERGALHGTPISDDLFLMYTPEIQELSLTNLRAILDPNGPVAHTYLNYAPVHALLHAVAIRLFGSWLPGHHGLNVVLHAVAALMLFQLFLDSGIGREAALAGAALFLVHPANVEPVAWMSQLKTTSATVLAMAALLLARRRPALALIAFALALLAKAAAAFALPVLAVLAWSEHDPRRRRALWRWVAGWALVFALYAPLQLGVFAQTALVSRPEFEADGWLHLRTVLAVAARYGWMAATSLGVSTEHEIVLSRSLADPWWLGGLIGLSALAARLVVTLRDREVEAAWWTWALAALLPVSQVTPFLHLMADRYLYTILPGLLGGVLLAGQAALRGQRAGLARPVLLTAVAALVLVFSLRSAERARVFRHMDAYYVDAALHYPDGITAHVLRGRDLARAGDVDGAIAALREARARGWSWTGIVFIAPEFASLRADPRFPSLARELSGPNTAWTGPVLRPR